jgi:hypothetical protein
MESASSSEKKAEDEQKLMPPPPSFKVPKSIDIKPKESSKTSDESSDPSSSNKETSNSQENKNTSNVEIKKPTRGPQNIMEGRDVDEERKAMLSKYDVPFWSSAPPSDAPYTLEEVKAGIVLKTIPVHEQPFYFIGKYSTTIIHSTMIMRSTMIIFYNRHSIQPSFIIFTSLQSRFSCNSILSKFEIKKEDDAVQHHYYMLSHHFLHRVGML